MPMNAKDLLERMHKNGLTDMKLKDVEKALEELAKQGFLDKIPKEESFAHDLDKQLSRYEYSSMDAARMTLGSSIAILREHIRKHPKDRESILSDMKRIPWEELL